MQFLTNERYPLHFYCHGTEDCSYLLEGLCHIALEKGETLISFCLVEGEYLGFYQCLGPFLVIFQQ